MIWFSVLVCDTVRESVCHDLQVERIINMLNLKTFPLLIMCVLKPRTNFKQNFWAYKSTY